MKPALFHKLVTGGRGGGGGRDGGDGSGDGGGDGWHCTTKD